MQILHFNFVSFPKLKRISYFPLIVHKHYGILPDEIPVEKNNAEHSLIIDVLSAIIYNSTANIDNIVMIYFRKLIGKILEII